ncbi:MAG: hypothetical protein KGI41_02425 [Patescibacteria group bacterium]|nr:hypothetical protein [Patescibacteria group bacterium]MDE1966070.1 hypothetical protein [Patescibacteria group bacterium]
MCGAHFTKAGSVIQFLAAAEPYGRSFEKIIAEPEMLARAYADFEAAEESLKAFAVKSQEDEEYREFQYPAFIRAYDAMYASGLLVDGTLISGEKVFSSVLERYPAHAQALRSFAQSEGLTFNARYRRAELRFAKEIEEGSVSQAEAAVSLARDFYWMHNNYKNVSALPVSFFAGQLEEARKESSDSRDTELAELDTYAEHRAALCASLRREAALSDADYETLTWFGRITWWVDRRKECNLIANHLIGKHLTRVAAQHDIPYEDAAFLLPWELEAVFSGKRTIDSFNLSARREESIYFHDEDGEGFFVTGTESKELWRKISPPVSSEDAEIKGTVAQKGVARGIARIVPVAHHPGTFNSGDILVTGMTRPDFLGLMKKAAAFVTDEGGITCHAAIVAREMKKPCVIGTKVATQVLKDGDLVEVDAEKGAVRIIERAA